MLCKSFRCARRALFLLAAVVVTQLGFAPRCAAISIPVDTYLEGDPAIIPLLPLGTLDITDIGPNSVRFDITLIPDVKFVNLGLGLSPSIVENQLVLTSLSGDQMSLDTGGWLGFPFKIEFNDKPTHPVSFQLVAPGLDVTDFLGLPASPKFPLSLFALNLWFVGTRDMIDSTVGGTTVPEPATISFLALGAIGVAYRRRRRGVGDPLAV